MYRNMRANKAGLYALGRLKIGELNKTEQAYESVLKTMQYAGEILWYKFEGIKLRLADNTFYTPDFFIMNKDGQLEAHECKGFAMDDSMVKIKVAAENFPFVFRLARVKPKKLGGGWDIKEVGNGN